MNLRHGLVRRSSVLATIAATTLVPTAAATPGVFELRQVSQTRTTVTFAWTGQAEADGYQFTRNGVVISRTFDPTLTRATFWKGARYGVQVLQRHADGRILAGRLATYVAGAKPVALQASRLVSVPAAQIEFRLRLLSQTAKTVTFGWRRQPGVDGFRFLRNGVVISSTFDTGATTATFWKGSRYAVDLLRVTDDKRVKAIRRALAVPSKPRGHQRFTFLSAPTIEFELRLLSETRKTVTFGWKRQPTVDGYQFLRNGVVVSRTFDRNTTSASFWKGSRYAVEAIRVGPGNRVIRVSRAVAYRSGLPAQ